MYAQSGHRQPLPVFADYEEFNRYLDARISARLSALEAKVWFSALRVVVGVSWLFVAVIWLFPLVRR